MTQLEVMRAFLDAESAEAEGLRSDGLRLTVGGTLLAQREQGRLTLSKDPALAAQRKMLCELMEWRVQRDRVLGWVTKGKLTREAAVRSPAQLPAVRLPLALVRRADATAT